MSTMSVQEKIEHYQRSIAKYTTDEKRVIHCLQRLRQLPVTVKHLQATGIGRTVNALRKFQGDAGNLARLLVHDWKQMVSDNRSEEEDETCAPEDIKSFREENGREEDEQETSVSRLNDGKNHSEKSSQSYSSTKVSEDCTLKNGVIRKDSGEKESRNYCSSDSSSRIEKSLSKDAKEHSDKHRHKSKSSKPSSKDEVSKKRKLDEDSSHSSSKKHKPESSRHSSEEASTSSSKSRRSEEKDEKRKKDKHRGESSKHKSDSESKSKHSKSKDKKRTHDKDKDKSLVSKSKTQSSCDDVISKDNNEKNERKRSSQTSSDDKAKKAKVIIDQDTGIDCNSGTSFGEALGMCSMPVPSRKRNSSHTTSKTSKPESSSLSKPSTSMLQSEYLKPENNISKSPSLLLPNAKLEPLKVNLAATLPEISPNYRPLPNIVKNAIHQKQEEELALSQAMSNKNQRTKVYSGNKNKGYLTSVPSLFDICIRMLIDNIDAIEQTGGIPYYILKPVLQIATPDQLFNIEHHNPYLLEDTDELWEYHCKKHFKKESSDRENEGPWRDMYMRCIEEREARLKGLTEGIKKKMIEKAQPVRTAKLAFVDNIVKPPRNVLRKQAKYGTAKDVRTTSSEVKKKLLINSSTSLTNISVPPPNRPRATAASASAVKKAKAPLMAKALQLIKGRFKR